MKMPHRFIDAHVHLWDLQEIRHPWLEPPFSDHGVNGNVQAIARDYFLDDYLEDAKDINVAGIVHVEAGADPAQSMQETRWLEQHLAGCGLPFSLVAFAALEAPDVDEQLAAQCQFPHVRGIRQIVNWHQNPGLTYTTIDLLADPAWRYGFSRLQHYGLAFDLQLYPGQMPDAAKLAAEHPETSIIINHMGMPIARDKAGIAAWRHGMQLLAQQPNVAVKLSGYGLVDRHWTADSIRPMVLDTIELFGIARCMFASDFPTDKLHASFHQVVSAYLEIVADFSGDDCERLFAKNAARLYRMELHR